MSTLKREELEKILEEVKTGNMNIFYEIRGISKDITVQLLNIDPYFLLYAGKYEDDMDDPVVIEKALENNPDTMFYIHNRPLSADKAFIKRCAKKVPRLLSVASHEVRDHNDVIEAAVSEHWTNIIYATQNSIYSPKAGHIACTMIFDTYRYSDEQINARYDLYRSIRKMIETGAEDEKSKLLAECEIIRAEDEEILSIENDLKDNLKIVNEEAEM